MDERRSQSWFHCRYCARLHFHVLPHNLNNIITSRLFPLRIHSTPTATNQINTAEKDSGLVASMNGFLPTRKRWLQERRPTAEELHAAEVAAFHAVYSGPRVLVSVPKIPDDMITISSASQLSKSIEESERNCQMTSLSETTDEDFLYGIRVNGRECMTTAYE